jgi:hypothetical protein
VCRPRLDAGPACSPRGWPVREACARSVYVAVVDGSVATDLVQHIQSNHIQRSLLYVPVLSTAAEQAHKSATGRLPPTAHQKSRDVGRRLCGGFGMGPGSRRSKCQ